MVPNLFWRHVSHESLRRLPDYKPLPKVEQLPLDSPACYRCEQLQVLSNERYPGLLQAAVRSACPLLLSYHHA